MTNGLANNGGTDVGLLLHAYIDGELDSVSALRVEQKLAQDAGLRAERDRILALRRVITDHFPHEDVPADLQRRIERAAIGRGAPARPSWRALAASVVIAAALGSSSTWLLTSQQVIEARADALVSSHIRGLMAPQPADIVSSERHTVKPWFNGRVVDAPRVIDLSGMGFLLVGGRVDVVNREPAPTLVYRRRQHFISLTAIPTNTGNAQPTKEAVDRGYNIIRWRTETLEYWAISDVNLLDLREFVRQFQTAP